MLPQYAFPMKENPIDRPAARPDVASAEADRSNSRFPIPPHGFVNDVGLYGGSLLDLLLFTLGKLRSYDFFFRMQVLVNGH